jgi:hypothetical protein
MDEPDRYLPIPTKKGKTGKKKKKRNRLLARGYIYIYLLSHHHINCKDLVFIYVILLLGGQAGRRAGDDILYRLMRKPFLIGLPLSFDPWMGKHIPILFL